MGEALMFDFKGEVPSSLSLPGSFSQPLPKKIPKLSLGRVSGVMTLFPAQQLESAALEKDLSCIIHGLSRQRFTPQPWGALGPLSCSFWAQG